MRRWLGVLLGLSVAASAQVEVPAANPGRPTVTNPATLPPVGFLQFERGYLGSLNSPNTAAEYGTSEVWRMAVTTRVAVQSQLQPYAASRDAGAADYSNGFGDVLLGVQAVAYVPGAGLAGPDGKSPIPTVSVGYLGRVHSGSTGDVDMGSYSHSLLLLFSGDFGGWHYDSNLIANVQPGEQALPLAPGSTVGATHDVDRAQFAQTLSVNHAVFNPNLQVSGEIYHFSQPLVTTDGNGASVERANLVDVLVAVSYQLKPNLVLDGGFSHGLTSTSTQWQSFAGFTYLLPRRIGRRPAGVPPTL